MLLRFLGGNLTACVAMPTRHPTEVAAAAASSLALPAARGADDAAAAAAPAARTTRTKKKPKKAGRQIAAREAALWYSTSDAVAHKDCLS